MERGRDDFDDDDDAMEYLSCSKAYLVASWACQVYSVAGAVLNRGVVVTPAREHVQDMDFRGVRLIHVLDCCWNKVSDAYVSGFR